MTLVRILTVVGIAVVAYIVFFGKPSELLIEEPAPQLDIDAAQTAINRRLEEIKLNPDDASPREIQALRNAQLGLSLLKETKK